MFTPKEVAQNYLNACETKAKLPFGRMFVLAILAGLFIAFAGAASGAVGRSSAGRAGADAPAASFATAEIVEEEARHGGMTRAQAREQAHAAQVYADMSMRGVMPTALAPGSFVATSITV